MEVTVIRSPKRRKTAQARMVDGRLEVRIPARVSQAEEARLVEGFRRRYERSERAAEIDLTARARRLARRLDLPEPTEIRWVGNQARQWGSCTPDTGVVRISDRLARVPDFVLDHVIVHELAHLVEADHGERFAALVARYRWAERAEGYLLALQGGVDPEADPLAGDAPGAAGDPPADASAEATGSDADPTGSG